MDNFQKCENKNNKYGGVCVLKLLFPHTIYCLTFIENLLNFYYEFD